LGVRTNVLAFVFSLTCFIAAVPCARADALPEFARRIDDARGVAYAAQVAPGLYRGGRPDAAGVAWLKRLGIKTVLNLRHFHGETERALVESAGIAYKRVALESSDVPTAQQLAQIMKTILDPTLRPLYVHCQHGVDRTGTVMAVYRMEIDRWTNVAALAEMDYFGAHKLWRDLRDFVRRYRPLGKYRDATAAR
jgi:tyrosine-protein phosphatase SIW14